MKRLFLSILLAAFSGMVFAGGALNPVKHGSTSVLLRFPLYDIDATPAGGRCATDVTSASTGLAINVSTDVTDGYYDQFQASDTTLEAITTIGTYATPTATKARFEIIAAGACTYELQLPDAAFAVTNAKLLTIEITDAGAEIIDDVFWVNLNVAEGADIADAVFDEACAGHVTAGTTGAQLCTDIDAILVDSNSLEQSSILFEGTCDNGSTTTCVDAALTEADDYWKGAAIVITSGSTAGQTSCVYDFTASSDTLLFRALTAAVSTNTYTLRENAVCEGVVAP